MHIIFYKSTSVLRSLLVPFFRGIHNYDIWYPARCSAAHKNLPEHGIKVRSKPEFDVFLAQILYIRPATADRNYIRHKIKHVISIWVEALSCTSRV